jgi:alginate O-acetyltransferase complex protein AlgI
MLCLGEGSIWDRQGRFLAGEYLILFVIAAVASTPLVKQITERIKNKRNGYAVAVLRLGEKLFIPILFVLSIAFIAAASYNPFLYFRF